MNIAFLGDSRFIGVSAAEAAIDAGHDVTIYHSGKYPTQLPDADYRVVNLGDFEAMRVQLRQGRFDALIDTFAMTRRNADVASRAAAGLVPHVIVLSSQDVYAQFGHLLGHSIETIEERVHEGSPLTVPYPFRGIAEHAGGDDYDKKLVEQVYCAADIASLTILRLPAVYGTRDTKRRFAWIVDRLDRGERVVPRNEGATWRWTHSHIGDVAAAIVASSENNFPGLRVMNLGERETPTMGERVEQIAQCMEVEFAWSDTAELPADLRYLGPMPCDFVADTSSSWSTLNISESPADECIDDMIGWLRASRRD